MEGKHNLVKATSLCVGNKTRCRHCDCESKLKNLIITRTFKSIVVFDTSRFQKQAVTMTYHDPLKLI